MRRRIGLTVGAIVFLVSALVTGREIRGLTLIVRAAEFHGVVRRLADLDTVRIDERIVSVQLPDESMRARVYAPRGVSSQTVLVVSGLHPLGIDEPRLVGLARRLAEANVTVVTPEIPQLARYEISPMLTDRIEQLSAWLAADARLTPKGRIGLMGISFSGGVAIVAAGRPALKDRLSYVLSFGGHDDLRRVLEYYGAGLDSRRPKHHGPTVGPALSASAPHDYSLAVTVLNVADRLVPPDQIVPLRDAVRRFLWASYLDQFDKAYAAREFAAVRTLECSLAEPGAAILRYVNSRDVARLGPRLLPHLGAYADAPALSPSLSPPPSAPVFLLHGQGDTVIPSFESRSLADRLRGRVPVRLMVTDVISHAEADRPTRVLDLVRLAHFWSDILNQ